MKYYLIFFFLIASGFFLTNFFAGGYSPHTIVNIDAANTLGNSTSAILEEPTVHESPQELTLSAKSFISETVDAHGNIEILAEKNSDMKLPIASITKLMTAIIAINNYDLNDTIVVSPEVIGQDGTTWKFKAGETFFVGDMLYPLLIGSNNDAARILASKIGEEKFIELMNQEALLLGLENTNYTNPTGLDPVDGSEPNRSTVTDLAKLASVIMRQYPRIINTTSLRDYNLITASGIFNHAVVTTDKLLDEMLPFKIIGGKTGETTMAKKNLLLITTNGFMENNYRINVILGSDDNFVDMRALLTSSASK